MAEKIDYLVRILGERKSQILAEFGEFAYSYISDRCKGKYSEYDDNASFVWFLFEREMMEKSNKSKERERLREGQRNSTKLLEMRHEVLLRSMGMVLSPERLEIGQCSASARAKRLPKEAGIYFLFDSTIDSHKIAYVGISGNIQERWTRKHPILERVTHASILRWSLMPREKARQMERKINVDPKMRPPLNKRL